MGGIDTKKVIKTACKTKTPPLRCHSPALPNTCLKAEPPTSIACSPGANCGIPQTAKSKHKKPKRLITQNSPDRPNCSTTRGETTNDKAKDKPIDIPIMAMARVRTSGRVASD